MGDWGSVGDVTDLVWRRDCVCCAAVDVPPAESGVPLCRGCAASLRRPAIRLGFPSAGLPVFAAGPYGGAHRGLVLAAKEHLRPEAVTVMGDVIAGTVRHLVAEGVLADPRLSPLVLVPAPTTRTAARQRGGCVVDRAARWAAESLNTQSGRGVYSGCVDVVAPAHQAESARDSVGLGRAQRRENIVRTLRFDEAGLNRLRRLLRRDRARACIVDDVTTTGATMGGFTVGLAARGVRVSAAVVVAEA
ncbi:MAG TPA: hypothetical protein H9870_06930 [Candidatus Corynebacterium avicola]|uniref:Phosphoribosyltransferase domain-containing protein n=1 Tax=Candidatus Corynebacterium avicola TaxID=2838527 RepID=A0A9D1RRI0_9CORY|nr:hypothetical protein [Candidatus Corynebacterium avicola]